METNIIFILERNLIIFVMKLIQIKNFPLQYKLDFSGLSGRSTMGNSRDDEGNMGLQGSDGSRGSATSEGSMWQYGLRGRGKGDARRTRVSFLLF